MPRRDHPVQLGQVLSYSERMLLAILLAELNSIRGELGMHQRTTEDIRLAMRQYLRVTPRHPPALPPLSETGEA